MKVTPESIRQRYRSMSTDDLHRLLKEGGITDEARGILAEELKARGASEEPARDYEPPSVVRTRWYTFYTYVRLPLNIMLSFLLIMSAATTASPGGGGRYAALLAAILMPLGILQVAVFFGMIRKQSWVLPVNEVLLGSEVLFVSLASGIQNGPSAFVGSLLAGALIWVWPNRTYFRNRSFMFA